jgi:molybdate transport system substrate-binding protein
MRSLARLALLCLLPMIVQARDLTVYAAASLTEVMQAISAAWEQTTEHHVKLSFAASSALAKQIEAGAQASVFVSADSRWMDYLATGGYLVPDTRVDLVGNRLVLVTPLDHPVSVALEPGFDLAALLGDGRLATGDPAHVPVGFYAEAALRTLRAWSIAEPKLVRADSVRAALVLVERGEVPAGIVYATDAAITPKVHVAGEFPANSHPPIVYPLAIIAEHDDLIARDFYAYLQSPSARVVFDQFGFTRP